MVLSRYSALESRYSRKLIDRDDYLDPELARVLDVLLQVLASLLQRDEVLLGVRVVQRLSGGDVGATSVHLQSASSGNDDGSIGFESTDTTLNVAELLHAHVGAETALGQDVADAV